MNRLPNEIMCFLSSFQKKKKVQALHSANKAGTLAKKLKTNNSLPSPYIASVMFGDGFADHHLLVTEVFKEHLALSRTTDDDTVIPDIAPVFSKPHPPRFSFHPDHSKLLLPKMRPYFHSGPDDLIKALFMFGCAGIPKRLSNLFNLSLDVAILPPQWKTSFIVTIHKKRTAISHIPGVLSFVKKNSKK